MGLFRFHHHSQYRNIITLHLKSNKREHIGSDGAEGDSVDGRDFVRLIRWVLGEFWSRRGASLFNLHATKTRTLKSRLARSGAKIVRFRSGGSVRSLYTINAPHCLSFMQCSPLRSRRATMQELLLGARECTSSYVSLLMQPHLLS